MRGAIPTSIGIDPTADCASIECAKIVVAECPNMPEFENLLKEDCMVIEVATQSAEKIMKKDLLDDNS